MIDDAELDMHQLQGRIRDNPADARAYCLLGGIFLRERRLQEAARAFHEALRLDPEDGTAELALCMLITGPDPSVEPSADLLKFFDQHGGSIIRYAQASGASARVADAGPQAP